MMSDITNALPGFEFYFADAPYAGGLWMMDPPGGKGAPTTDPNWAIESYNYLDTVVASEGPFHGIAGYSQGSAFVSAYLSHAPANTFQVAIMFCGYIPTTHEGITADIQSASPFGNIP